MLRNHEPLEVGQAVVVCHVPEHDLSARLYHCATVAEVWDDGQIILDDGSRTGTGSCWKSLRSIAEAVRTADALAAIDERLLRSAF